MNADTPYMRCTHCALELTKAESQDLTCCPRCGTKGLPMLVADDVTVEVNWHELRILGMWAENYAAQHKDRDPQMQRVVNIICGRIHAQHPERAPLTMTGELGDLRSAIESGEIPASGMEVTGFSEDVTAQGPES